MEPAPPAEQAGRSISRKQWLFLLRVALLVLLAVLSYKIVRVGLFAMSAYNHAAELRQLRADGDLDVADLAQVQVPVAEAARAVAGLEQEMRFFAPVLHTAEPIPRVGPTVAAIPELLVAGREYALMAGEGLRLVAEAQSGAGDAPLPRLALSVVADNPEAFASFAGRARIAEGALNQIDAAKLLPDLAGPLAQLQSVAQLASAGLSMAPALPDMLGYYGPRSYLLLVQNNHELRATGGFISAVGRVTVENATILSARTPITRRRPSRCMSTWASN